PSEPNSFRRFTPESLKAIEERIAKKKNQQKEVKRENKDQGIEEEKLTPQLDLKTYKTLPSLYGDLPAELIGEPLEDFDPYYSDHKTFMVINKHRTIFRFTATPALCIFGPFNPVRKTAIKIMIHSYPFIGFPYLTFKTFCTIFCHSVPLLILIYVFTAIYSTEIGIKIMARGFVWNEFTFLRDPWNCLDLSIIIVMYITIFQSTGNVSALRTFRVLRTLKAISVIPGLKVIVNSLVESVKKLADVLILTLFCLSVFALIGLQLFMGNLKSKCVLNTAVYNDSVCVDPKIYTRNSTDVCYRVNNSSEILLCGYSSEPKNECPNSYNCTNIGKNPDFGYTSFDHFGWAFLSVFRVMTQDNWERLYRQTIRTSGVTCIFFFMAVIFFCSFYLFNLILAVVTMAYEEQNRATLAETVAKKKLLQDAQQIIEKEQVCKVLYRICSSFYLLLFLLKQVAAGESSEASHVRSEMPVADLKNSKGKEFEKEAPVLRQDLILGDQDKEEQVLKSQPDHCHRKLKRKSSKSSCAKREYQGTVHYDVVSLSTPSLSGSLSSGSSNYSLPGTEISVLSDCFCLHIPPILCSPRFRIIYLALIECEASLKCVFKTHIYLMLDIRFVLPVLHIPVLYYLLLSFSTKRQILMSYDVSVDSINDPLRRQRLMSAATIITDNSQSKPKCPTFWKCFAQKYLIWNCCPFWKAVKEKVQLVILDPFVDLLIMVCIVLNTLAMAMEYPGMPPNYQIMIYRSDKVFTLIFTVEMILKIIALDPYYYFQKKWNVFDSLVVLIGLLSFEANLSYLRLLRIFKLAKSWPALNTLMRIILNSFGALSNLTLVLAITVFIFAVVGMQFLSGDYKNNFWKISTSKNLRWHMKDFSHSLLIIFRILCGEWIETMWECMEVAGKAKCLTIFLLVLVIGNLVVLNLFIALLLSSFNTDAPEGQEEPEEGTKCQIAIARICKGLKSVKDRILDLCSKKKKGNLKRTDKKKTLVEISGKDVEDNYAMTDIRKYIDHSCFDIECYHTEESSSKTRKCEEVLTSHSTCVPITAAETHTYTGDDEHIVCTKKEYRKEKRRCSVASTADPVVLLEMFSQPENSHLPKNCFSESCVKWFPCCTVDITKSPGRIWWNFRKNCYRIVNHSGFEYFVIFMIILSSAALAFEDIHLQKRKKVKIILEYADKIFTYVFFMEMLLKWVAYGLHSYFTNSWCLLDFAIVCLSFASWGQNNASEESSPCSSGSSLKSLRTLRALRPLRALSRFEGIKVVVNALFGAIPSIINVLLVCVVFWLLFNIVGVKWLGKRFSKCILEDKNVNISNKSDCTFHGGKWTNNIVNFDNVGMGYLALLQVATFKGWMDIMYAAVDSRGIDEQPTFEACLPMYIYFVVFIIFGSFFMLNLFIGVVISNFNQQRKKISGKDLFLTEEQKKYYNALKKLGSKKPQKPIPRPSNAFLGLLFDIVSHKAFDITIVIFICLNMVVMMAENNENSIKPSLNKINYFFVVVFAAECVIKILGLRQYYFRSGWNLFDFSVVVLSIVSIGVSEAFENLFSPTVLRTFRLARIGRILRLVRKARGIRTLLFALLMSLPALVNIGLLLFLIMFIYAIVGMANFACLPFEGGIDNIFNFQTFCGSILCLFQITTSAGWDSLLAPVLKESDTSDTCAPGLNLKGKQKTSCANMWVGILYFVSYVILSFLIVVNMYIAVILENFSVATEESTDPLCEDDFDMFYETWGKFDPLATQFIEYSALSDFADALAEPLRIPKPNKIQLIAMDLPIVSGDKIHCLDILLAFTKRVLGESGDLDSLELHMEENIVVANPRKSFHKPISSTLKRKQEEVSALIIQRAFRRHLVERSFKNTSVLHHRKDCNSTVSGEETQDKQSLIESMHTENSGRKLDKPRPASSISLPLFYDGIAKTDSNKLD
ncbi:Sodium channel protein type 10 subunit alpha, partial [Acanthisitta chloris]